MRKGEVKLNNRQLGINMIANIVSYASNLFVSFFMTPFLIQVLGKETYSFYPIANTVITYISVLSVAMNTMASRFVTVSLARNNEEEANKYFSSVMASNVIITLFLTAPVLVLIVFLDNFMDVPINSLAAVRVLFALTFAATFSRIIGANFGIATLAKNRIDLRSLREIITSVLRLVLYVVFYRCFTPSIVYIGIVACIVEAANILIQYAYTKQLMPEIKLAIKYISLNHTKELLKSSSWNMVNYLGEMMLVGMTMVQANIYFNASASGAYSAVQVVPSFISGVITMMAGVFYPTITYRYVENETRMLVEELHKAQNLVALVSCAVIVVFAVMSERFFSLWVPGEDSVFFSKLLWLSIFPQFFVACFWPLENLNIIMNKVKGPAIVILCVGILNIIITHFAIRDYNAGLISIPVVCGVIRSLWAIIYVPQYACKILKLKWHVFYMPMLRALIAAIPVYMITKAVCETIQIDSWLSFIFCAILTGCIALIIYFLIMFWPKLFSLLKK